MEQSILELVLNYYRSPSQYPELVDVEMPLPQGIDFLLELVSGKVKLDTNELQDDLKGVSVSDLKAASVFYIEHVFFNSNANFYRTLGLNPNATQDQIRHHYSALIHILCLDQEDKAAQWDEAYAMRINRAYSVLRIPEKREKYNKQHDIVASDFSGDEKRCESRKVLDGSSSESSSEGQSSASERNSINSSFIAANIDRAYLSKDNKSVVDDAEPVKTVAVANEIDSASPENLYVANETAADTTKECSEQNKKTAVETKKTEELSVGKLPLKMGTYSLVGVLLLVAMGVAIIYFTGNLRTELDISDEYKTTALEPEKPSVELVEKTNDIPKEDIVDVDLGKEENIEPYEFEEESDVDVVATEITTTDSHEMSDSIYVDELPQLEDSDIVTKIIEEVESVDEGEVLSEYEQENFDNDIAEFVETDHEIELIETADEPLDDSVVEEYALFDGDDLTEINQEIDVETSIDELNAEKLSAIVRDFVRYYNAGDLDQFIQLFAEDAKTDDRENINGIREDYADAFNLTVKRKFLIDDVRWVMLNENNGLGTADFVLFIQALGEDRFAEYTGEITFYIEDRDDALLITGLYHQYNE